MCTFIESPDVRILVDASAALGPRGGKLPHPREYSARNLYRGKIREFAARADVIVVSHYHYDHHTSNFTDTVWTGSSPEEAERIYRDKTVLVKDIRNAINFSQRRRGWMFQGFLKKIGARCEVADGKSYDYGATQVKVSPPVPHGEDNSELGWLIMTTVKHDGNKVLHASDVQGPMSKLTTRIILKERPDMLVLGGPPAYLEGIKVERKSIDEGIKNASAITAKVPTVILEHHLLRSENWRKRASAVFREARRRKHNVFTAAEFAGLKNNLLEARRGQLYEREPPSAEFLKWTEMPREKRRITPPPI